MVSVMDVDMAAAVIIASHAAADRLGVPADQRVYIRGWGYATDPTYVAEHRDLWRSPAMAAASAQALRTAGTTAGDVAHLDLYSCFASSLHFAKDALGIADTDERALTVTGGLPYHGGPGSGYMTHAIAEMARVLRRDPGSFGLTSGVGMHMTKHVFGVYSTAPGELVPPDPAEAQRHAEATTPVPIVDEHDGEATVAAYSVIHGRDGEPETGVLVCDVAGGRAYGSLLEPAALADAESTELVGSRVHLTPTPHKGPMGDAIRNVATIG
jgi:acetyl-CoA C-acetyltransferase